jgi:UDP-3-O-[3-hydroxymyristoyl] N-acetylglucosamine deacetylase/3-hydroxyacyl-[acyl-carrier-protein] dehydratase
MRKPLVAAQAFSPPPAAPKAALAAEGACDETKAQDGAMDIQGVMKLLPHRYPFLMVDRIAKIDGNHVIGIKNVTINESYFQGHFPGHPVMPGVLQLEAMAQVAGILMLKNAENAGKMAYFMAAEDVKWRKPVHPGDVLVIDVELTKVRGKIGKAKGVCKVGGEVVSEAAVTFMLFEG